jgi:hypothetical protein
MGFLKTGTTFCDVTSDNEMQVYLTNYGKDRILAQSFVPRFFTLNDSDVNYLTNQVMNKSMPDISGDYDDNVFSLSKLRNIKGSIIYKLSGTTIVQVESASVPTGAASE